MKVVGLGHGAFTLAELEQWGLTSSLNGEVNSSNLNRILKDFGAPTVVFHLAGGSSVGPSIRIPEEDFQRTVVSTSALLDWLRLNAPDSKVVLSSSAAVYGAMHNGPIAESAETIPFSPYGFHKRMAELLFESYYRNFGLNCSFVRLFSVYGSELRKQLLWDVCQRLSRGTDSIVMHGSGEECRDWFHVEDCVRLLGKVGFAQEKSSSIVLNGGTGVSVRVKEIVEHVMNEWGGIRGLHFNGVVPLGDPRSLVADTQLARSIGFEPSVPWQDGIREYVSWFKDQRL
jgi:UDP-glucose 4-epimerase